MASDNVVNITRAASACHTCATPFTCLSHEPAETGNDACDDGTCNDIGRQTHTWQRGEHLFHAGETFHSFFILRSGSVKVYTLDNEGEEHVLGFCLAGDSIGIEAMLDGVHNCAAVTLETSNICALQLNSPDMRMNAFYARALIREHNVLRLLSKKTAEQRLAGFLLNLSRHFAERGFSAHAFNLSMSRYEIGNHLGLALETVSRLFARFRQDGLIQIDRRRVRIQDPDALTRLAGEMVWQQVRQRYQ
jgi:CRP/FNR family transcriptional regulator